MSGEKNSLRLLQTSLTLSGDNFHEIHPFAILQVSGDAKRYETGDEDNYSQVGFESFVTHST